jgi:DNA-binding NtrC family response regulator
MSQELGRNITKIEPEVVDAMSAYDFPGNIRELKIMVESAVIRCGDTVLSLSDFSAKG